MVSAIRRNLQLFFLLIFSVNLKNYTAAGWHGTVSPVYNLVCIAKYFQLYSIVFCPQSLNLPACLSISTQLLFKTTHFYFKIVKKDITRAKEHYHCQEETEEISFE